MIGLKPCKEALPDIMPQDFRRLRIWQTGRTLRNELYHFCQSLPKSEQLRLSDQVIRASRSVTANIAEGYGRYHYKETIQFLRHARGSLYELIDHLDTAQACRHIQKTQFDAFECQILNLIRSINAYVKYLKTRKEGTL